MRVCVPVSPIRLPLRMDQRRVEPDSNTGNSPVTLYGEFTFTGNRKVRCAVSLTERELVIQRLTSAPVGRSKVVLSLKDCVGCRAYHREDDDADPAAYLSLYFYPLKRRWMSSGVSRQRVEHCFRLAALQDPRANLEEAEKWARAVRERAGRQQYLRDGEFTLGSLLSLNTRVMLSSLHVFTVWMQLFPGRRTRHTCYHYLFSVNVKKKQEAH